MVKLVRDKHIELFIMDLKDDRTFQKVSKILGGL